MSGNQQENPNTDPTTQNPQELNNQPQGEQSNQPENNVQNPNTAIDEEKKSEDIPDSIKRELVAEEQREVSMKEALNYDPDLMDKQHEAIRKEIEEDSPLISDILPLDMLEFEFANNLPFLNKVKNLKKKYPDYRKVRRDGSCFYRAFLFRLFEYMIRHHDQALLEKFETKIKDSKKFLMEAGFEEFVIEDFQQALLDVIDDIKKGKTKEREIQESFCDKVKSDSLVMYMRLLTSGYLRNNAILFEHFLENGMTMEHFCQTEVEPIDRDSDQIQITALINHLEIPIKIIYLDASNKEVADELYIPEDTDRSKVFITFLYRPGHYDLLYS